jgi:2-dehydro-3-deoxygalactonokinase
MSIYGDWGSTHLRLWRSQAGTIVGRREGPGIVALDRPPLDALRQALAGWELDRDERLVLCGMAGARGGLREVAYVDCPADEAAWRREAGELALGANPLLIAAGLACRGDGRPDVMRGEETQVFGALRLRPDLARSRRLVVHPGTHSKWIELEDGMVRHFKTYPSGEMFALLQRSSMAGVAQANDDADEADGFEAGLGRAETQPGLLGVVFEARAAQVRDGRSGGWAKGFLSGLVLGCEVSERRQAGGLAEQVVAIGEPALTERYARVLGRFGVTPEILDGEACVLAGLELLDADI